MMLFTQQLVKKRVKSLHKKCVCFPRSSHMVNALLHSLFIIFFGLPPQEICIALFLYCLIRTILKVPTRVCVTGVDRASEEWETVWCGGYLLWGVRVAFTPHVCWCRLDPCGLHSSWFPGVWRKLSAQLQHPQPAHGSHSGGQNACTYLFCLSAALSDDAWSACPLLCLSPDLYVFFSVCLPVCMSSALSSALSVSWSICLMFCLSPGRFVWNSSCFLITLM